MLFIFLENYYSVFFPIKCYTICFFQKRFTVLCIIFTENIMLFFLNIYIFLITQQKLFFSTLVIAHPNGDSALDHKVVSQSTKYAIKGLA